MNDGFRTGFCILAALVFLVGMFLGGNGYFGAAAALAIGGLIGIASFSHARRTPARCAATRKKD